MRLKAESSSLTRAKIPLKSRFSSRASHSSVTSGGLVTTGRNSTNSRPTVAMKYIDNTKMTAPMAPDDSMNHQILLF